MHTGHKIAVAGATGRVGGHVVDVLEERGHDVVPICCSGSVEENAAAFELAHDLEEAPR